MIGKILYYDRWHFCQYENNKLEILRANCETPLFIKNARVKFTLRAAIAFFEDGSSYFFDLDDICENIESEYVIYCFNNPNYFMKKDANFFTIKKFSGIKKVTLKNGVLKPMLELSSIQSFDVNFGEILAKVCFRVKKIKDNLLCKLSHGKKLTNHPSTLNEYCVEICFKESINIDTLNELLDRFNKLIQFINMDYNAPIGKVEVKTTAGSFLYFKRGINYSQQPIVRYNHVNYCKSIIQELTKNMLSEKYDLGFLSLIDKASYTPNDYWILAKSIEKNIDKDDVNLKSEKLRKEISLYEDLKEKIEKTIEEFEKENTCIDPDKKNYILSSVELPIFRKRVEYIFEIFNEFSNIYKKYPHINDRDIEEYSKQLGYARNTIHGVNNGNLNSDKSEESAKLVIVGMYLYILKKNNANDACKFNLIQCLLIDLFKKY